MARLATPYICDYCGVQKRETNHWWLAAVSRGIFILEPWDYADPDKPDVIHLCGAECAQKALAKHMETIQSANAGKSQPVDEPQEERKNKNESE